MTNKKYKIEDRVTFGGANEAGRKYGMYRLINFAGTVFAICGLIALIFSFWAMLPFALMAVFVFRLGSNYKKKYFK